MSHTTTDVATCECDECKCYRQDRDKAVRFVLLVLRNPLMLMSVPDRERAETAAQSFGITAEDLLRVALHRAQHT